MAADTPTTIDQLAAAVEACKGRTPREIIDAFLPGRRAVLGFALVPLTMGHEVALAKLGHPLATGRPWDNVDVLLALFVFSRSSRESFDLIMADAFEKAFFEFVESLPLHEPAELSAAVVEHWAVARATALEMTSPHGSKKNAAGASAGCSTPSPEPAPPSIGRRIMRCMTYLWRAFSRSTPPMPTPPASIP